MSLCHSVSKKTLYLYSSLCYSVSKKHSIIIYLYVILSLKKSVFTRPYVILSLKKHSVITRPYVILSLKKSVFTRPYVILSLKNTLSLYVCMSFCL